jgi:hypothetical protein
MNGLGRFDGMFEVRSRASPARHCVKASLICAEYSHEDC